MPEEENIEETTTEETNIKEKVLEDIKTWCTKNGYEEFLYKKSEIKSNTEEGKWIKKILPKNFFEVKSDDPNYVENALENTSLIEDKSSKVIMLKQK